MAFTDLATWSASEQVTAAQLNARLVDNQTAMGDGPRVVQIIPLFTPVASSTWASFDTNTTGLFAAARQSSNTKGSYISFDVTLPKGAWTLRLVGITRSDGAMVVVDLDGVEIGRWNMYSGSTVRNVTFDLPFTSPTSAKQRVTFTAADTDINSGGYVAAIALITFVKTGG